MYTNNILMAGIELCLDICKFRMIWKLQRYCALAPWFHAPADNIWWDMIWWAYREAMHRMLLQRAARYDAAALVHTSWKEERLRRCDSSQTVRVSILKHRLSDVLLSGISLSWDLDNHLTISFQTILVFRTRSDPRTREQMWITLHVGIGNRFLERMKWNSSNSTLTWLFLSSSHGKPGTPPTHRPFSKHFRH